MNKLINLLIALSVLSLLFSCGENEEVASGPVEISGQITGIEGLEITAASFYELGKATADGEGNFSMLLDLNKPAYVLFSARGLSWELFLVPGDRLEISADKDSWEETFEVTGDRMAENRFLNVDKKAVLEQYLWEDLMSLFRKNKKQYLEQIEKGTDALNNLIDELDRREDIHPLFAKAERSYPGIESVKLNSNYPRYHMHIHGISDAGNLDFPAEDMESQLLQFKLDDPDLLALPSFRELLTMQMYRAFEEHIEDEVYEGDMSLVLATQINTINSLFSHPDIAEFMVYDYIKTSIMMGGPGAIDQFYDHFIEHSAKSEYISDLKHEMGKWEQIRKGVEVPDFKFEDASGSPVSLSEFRGQLVYIDVWATWCGPCLREHPYWDQLVADFEGESVVFLAVSIDNTREPWLRMLGGKDMAGVHWYAEGNWRSDFASHFLVQSIPRFILLDENGRVLEASAARPSGNIAQTIGNYLSERSL